VRISKGDHVLKFIEVVGSSPQDYSEAVRDAVESLIASGEKVHFFQVVEERGSVREGKIKEFQVVIKVAVEPADPAPTL
jgi:flavin-binding protein dodecin